MANRIIKKKIKKGIVLTFLALATLAVVYFAFNVFKPMILAFTTRSIVGNEKILRPIGQTTEVSELAQKLEDKNIIFEELRESSNAADLIIGKVRDGPKVYFSKNIETTWQVNSLRLILLKLTIDNKKPSLIDLRFDHPIVKF